MAKDYIIILLLLISSVFSRDIHFNSLAYKAHLTAPKTQHQLIDKSREYSLFRTEIDINLIWSEGFEGNTENWLRNTPGWLITDTDSSPNSISHSMWSPNDITT